jgi:hypothetical protein
MLCHPKHEEIITMTNNGYFNIKRDNKFIAAGTHFWCQVCLIARPLSDHSPDPRYCQSCYDFLVEEAKLLNKWKLPDWVPITKGKKAVKEQGVEVLRIPEVLAGINGVPAKTQPRENNQGGRPRLNLPVKQIRKWQREGYGATEIKRRLADSGVRVSMRSLYRML